MQPTSVAQSSQLPCGSTRPPLKPTDLRTGEELAWMESERVCQQGHTQIEKYQHALANTGNMTHDGQVSRACPGQDIISEIPDVVRVHILTFLPRKDAVRTGVLSTKWKDLFKIRFVHETTLRFGRATQSNEEQNTLAAEINEQMKQHGNRKVECFYLSFYPGKEHEKMTAEWIEQAVTNGGEVISFDFSQGDMGDPTKKVPGRVKLFEVKESFFKCSKYLTSLNLKYCRLQRNFRFKYFTCLECLCLRRVNINDQMLGRLVFNCQTLQVLELSHCKGLKDIRVLTWQLRLKKLIISNCSSVRGLEISAPLLETFYFFGRCPESFVMFYNMPLLSDAIITGPTRNGLDFLNPGYSIGLIFLWLENLKVLTLCSSTLLSVFEMMNNISLVFEKVRELQLLMQIMSLDERNVIYKFFALCQFPYLERLFIELPLTMADHHIYPMRCLQSPPEITLENLKMIKMNNFNGHLNEKVLLEFFLRIATRLELIVLVFSHAYTIFKTHTERMAVLDEIMKKPRASPNAKLVWFYDFLDDHTYRAVHAESSRQLCQLG